MKKTILAYIIALIAMIQLVSAVVITPNVIMPNTPVYVGNTFTIKLDVTAFNIPTVAAPVAITYNLTQNAALSTFGNIIDGSLTIPASGTPFSSNSYSQNYTAIAPGNYNITAQVSDGVSWHQVSTNITILDSAAPTLTISAPTNAPQNEIFNISVNVQNLRSTAVSGVYLQFIYDPTQTNMSGFTSPKLIGAMAAGASNPSVIFLNSTTKSYAWSLLKSNFFISPILNFSIIGST